MGKAYACQKTLHIEANVFLKLIVGASILNCVWQF